MQLPGSLIANEEDGADNGIKSWECSSSAAMRWKNKWDFLFCGYMNYGLI